MAKFGNFYSIEDTATTTKKVVSFDSVEHLVYLTNDSTTDITFTINGNDTNGFTLKSKESIGDIPMLINKISYTGIGGSGTFRFLALR